MTVSGFEADLRIIARVIAVYALLLIPAARGETALPPVPMPDLAAAEPIRPEDILPSGVEVRELSLRHHWTRESLTVVYMIDGVYQPEALGRINWFLRDYRCNKTMAIDPALLDLLWMLGKDLAPSGPVRIVSAYRSEGYNASLLRAGRTVDPNSQHMYGRAIDVIFPGVKLDALKEAALKYRLGGVGHYPFSGPPFLHLDTGPVRAWEEIHPSQRRTMPIALRPRTRLRIDCGLKMADVLQSVSLQQAYAALPDGAISDIRARLLPQLPLAGGEEDHPPAIVTLPALAMGDPFHPLASIKPKPGGNRCSGIPNRTELHSGSVPLRIKPPMGEALAQQIALRLSDQAMCPRGAPCRVGPRRAGIALALQGVDLSSLVLLVKKVPPANLAGTCQAAAPPPAARRKHRRRLARSHGALRLHGVRAKSGKRVKARYRHRGTKRRR